MALDEAVVKAGRVRLRPILMSTLTTVLGLLPLALIPGEGRRAARPLAIPVIGGLIVSTLLTLIVVPVLYRVFEIRGERARRAAMGGSGAPPERRLLPSPGEPAEGSRLIRPRSLN
jgi:hydrophobic/amphiphilic exporter-1 (mainly G- bacteria), HAE1 family